MTIVRAQPTIVRVPLNSTIGAMALGLMDDHSDGRITQESLDMYRSNYSMLDELTTRVVLLAAIVNGDVVGMSACVVQDNEMYNGVTVVKAPYRKYGIGSLLMRTKAGMIKKHIPNCSIKTKVAASNIASLKALINASFKATSMCMTTKNSGDKIPCFTFEY